MISPRLSGGIVTKNTMMILIASSKETSCDLIDLYVDDCEPGKYSKNDPTICVFHSIFNPILGGSMQNYSLD